MVVGGSEFPINPSSFPWSRSSRPIIILLFLALFLHAILLLFYHPFPSFLYLLFWLLFITSSSPYFTSFLSLLLVILLVALLLAVTLHSFNLPFPLLYYSSLCFPLFILSHFFIFTIFSSPFMMSFPLWSLTSCYSSSKYFLLFFPSLIILSPFSRSFTSYSSSIPYLLSFSLIVTPPSPSLLPFSTGSRFTTFFFSFPLYQVFVPFPYHYPIFFFFATPFHVPSSHFLFNKFPSFPPLSLHTRLLFFTTSAFPWFIPFSCPSLFLSPSPSFSFRLILIGFFLSSSSLFWPFIHNSLYCALFKLSFPFSFLTSFNLFILPLINCYLPFLRPFHHHLYPSFAYSSVISAFSLLFFISSSYSPMLSFSLSLTSRRQLVVSSWTGLISRRWSLVLVVAFHRGLFFVVFRVVFPGVASFVRHFPFSRPSLFFPDWSFSFLPPWFSCCVGVAAAGSSEVAGVLTSTPRYPLPWRGFSCGDEDSFCWGEEEGWVGGEKEEGKSRRNMLQLGGEGSWIRMIGDRTIFKRVKQCLRKYKAVSEWARAMFEKAVLWLKGQGYDWVGSMSE